MNFIVVKVIIPIMKSIGCLRQILEPPQQSLDPEDQRIDQQILQEAQELQNLGEEIRQDLKTAIQKVVPDDYKLDIDQLIEAFIDSPFLGFYNDDFKRLLEFITTHDEWKKMLLCTKSSEKLPIVFACSQTQLECLLAHVSDTPNKQQKIAMGCVVRGCIISLVLHLVTQENDPLRSSFIKFIRDHAELTVNPIPTFLQQFKLG